jgi:hypothetical protein
MRSSPAAELTLVRLGGRTLPGLIELLQQEMTMADDLSDKGAQDRARINVNEPHEVRYWTKALGISEERLREVVARIGTSAQDVRKELGAD